MKRLLILTILCSLSFTGLTAQIRYCMSYADYMSAKKNQRNSAANILRVFRHWRLIS